MNKFQWNFNQNKNLFENASEYIVCEMAAILSRGRRVNSNAKHQTKYGSNQMKTMQVIIRISPKSQTDWQSGPSVLSWPSCKAESKKGINLTWSAVTLTTSAIQTDLNSLWPGDAIWRHGTRSTLAQVMVCCLTAPSHYLNQCWLVISEVPWYSSQGIIIRWCEDANR